MKSFCDFLSENEEQVNIDNNALFKLKEKAGKVINNLLEYLQDSNSQKDLESLKNNILSHGIELEQINKEFLASIQSLGTRAKYQKHYNRISSIINSFNNPPADIDNLIKNLIYSLNILFVFIQTKIRI